MALLLALLLAPGCKSTGRQPLDPSLRPLTANAVDVTVSYVYVPCPQRPEMSRLDPSKHIGSQENVSTLWDNFQRLQKYASDLEGVVAAYRDQAKAAVESMIDSARGPEPPPK